MSTVKPLILAFESI